MNRRSEAESRPRSAIAKMVTVLEALAEEHGISGIARRTGLPVSTVHRILQELNQLGWVRNDGEQGYLLGARLLSLAGQAADSDTVARVAHPVLNRLSEQCGYAVHFAVRSGDEAVYVDKVEGQRAYRMRSRIGLAIRLHCTAIGKAVLANLAADEVRAILSRTGMPAMTPRTITNPGKMLDHLATVRAHGCAVDDEENEDGIRCVGAAVVDHRGVTIGGLSVSGLAFEVDADRVQQLVPLVRNAADTVSGLLGAAQSAAETTDPRRGTPP